MIEKGKRDKMVMGVLESVLEAGHYTARGNMAFVCPFCHHPKPKLEIQLQTNEKKENPWHCWVCGKKGKTIYSLFSKIKAPQHKIQELNLIIQPGKIQEEHFEIISLPDEFIPLHQTNFLDRITNIESKHALKFLKSRGITEDDILKYNIGFCFEGNYNHRIIVPSYNSEGGLNYFVSRTYILDEPQKYKNPPIGRNIIGWEYYINWDVPLILVEGIFDALTIKRNVIPLFGKTISEELMKKIVGSQVKKIYIALDNDALREAIGHCERLISFGKEVYLVELDGKDASEIGFENFLNIIENTIPLDFPTLLNKKLNLL